MAAPNKSGRALTAAPIRRLQIQEKKRTVTIFEHFK
jgi:hypothetical protein